MLRSEAVTIIKGRCARFNDTVLEPHIINELKQAQVKAELLPVLPWFLISEDAYIDADAGEPRVAVPSDFLREVDDSAVFYVDSEGGQHRLIKMPYDDLVERYEGDGRPYGYALRGKYFVVRPYPLTGDPFRLRMNYYAKDEVLSTDIENKWLKHYPEWMISAAGQVIAGRYLRDEKAAEAFRADLTRETNALITAEQARIDANQQYVRES